jgi:hypothetical protein
MNLELAILLDTEAIQITWCPRGGQVEDHQGGSNGTDSNTGSVNASIPRLGLLAVLDTRGRLAVYGVPVPSKYRKAAGISNNDLVFRKSLKFIFCSDRVAEAMHSQAKISSASLGSRYHAYLQLRMGQSRYASSRYDRR